MIDQQQLEALAGKLRDAAYAAQFPALDRLLQTPTSRQALDLHFYIYCPIPGDLVAEISSRKRGVPALDAVGTLVSVKEEPVELADGETWDVVARGRPRPTETVTRLLTLNDREIRWTNCEFLAIVTDPSVSYKRWRAEREQAANRCVEQGLLDQLPPDPLG
jgi:hypothetical protein